MGFPKSLPPVMRKPQGAGPARVTVTGMAAGGSGREGSRGVRKPWGAEETRQRRALSSLHEAQPGSPPAGGLPLSPLHPTGPRPCTPRVPSTGPMETGSAFLPGRGPVSSRRRRVPAATAASSCCPGTPGQGWRLPPLPSPPRDEGVPGTRCRLRWCSRWDGAGEVTPPPPGPCARQEIGAALAARPVARGMARQSQASGVWRGGCGCEGSQRPAREGSCCSPRRGLDTQQGCKHYHPESFVLQQTRAGRGC